MQKKTVLLIIFLVLSFSLFSTGIRLAQSQEFTSQKAYQDYLYNQTLYETSLGEYERAKGFYLKNPTLTLREEARKKTLTMLMLRDELTRVYLTALRMNIFENKGLESSEKERLFSKLDEEVSWYKNHKENYKEGDPLGDLFTKSDQAASRYKDITTPRVYDTLFSQSLGEVVAARKDQEEIYASLKVRVEEDVTNGKYKIDPFNRWFNDIETTVSDLKTKEEKAKKQSQKIYSQIYNLRSVYKTSIEPLVPAVESLRQLNRFLEEVINSIKNQA